MTQEYDNQPATRTEANQELPREPMDRALDREASPPQDGRPDNWQQEPRQETRGERAAMAQAPSGQPAATANGSGMAEYRARFEQLQAQFIEEPRSAVRSAQSLVEEAVTRLMHGLQQAGGEGADTEQLRLAMKRYRDLLYQVTETS